MKKIYRRKISSHNFMGHSKPFGKAKSFFVFVIFSLVRVVSVQEERSLFFPASEVDHDVFFL